MDWEKVIGLFYKEDDALRNILLVHSRAVRERALRISKAHPELQLDDDFIAEAAMLHDIGIINCDAPGISCHGTEPYICHGHIGAEMLRKLDLPRHARVCERHTGAGLTAKDIAERQLPLPEQDFLPETPEEKVICYADKFYSKSHLQQEKTPEQAVKSLSKFGTEGLQRFLQWMSEYESADEADRLRRQYF